MVKYDKVYNDVFNVACVVGHKKGGRKVKISAGEGTACKDAIIFFVFFLHLANVKILIGQIK